MATIRDALETGELQTLSYVLPTIRGDRRQFEARVVPIDDNQVVTIVRDATELRQTERDLVPPTIGSSRRVTPSGGGSSEISTTARSSG